MSSTRGILNKDEQQIQNNLVRLSQLSEHSIKTAVSALLNIDRRLAEQVIENDTSINQLYNDIEQACISTIATQQPVATDLRALVAGMHIAMELERIADHAAGIAKTVLQIERIEGEDSIQQVSYMSETCCIMLAKAIQAYVKRDVDTAKYIAHEDNRLDQFQSDITQLALESMCDSAEAMHYNARLLWVVHSLERIGDRITNICEQIVFINTGIHCDLNG